MIKSALRRRVSPGVPFTLRIDNAEGFSEMSVRLSYDLNAMALVEEVTGISMITDLGKIFERPTIGTATALFWAALQENHSDDFGGIEGLKTVRQLLTYGNLKDALVACGKAFTEQLPKDQADKIKAANENPQKPEPVEKGQ